MQVHITEVQKNLNILGYYTGKIDGIVGPKTIKAIIKFQQRYFVDGVIDQHLIDALDEATKSWLSQHIKTILPVPKNQKQIEEFFGKIEYTDLDGGYVKVTNNWVRENIVNISLPIVGYKSIHRKMLPVFISVLNEIMHKCLECQVHEFYTWCTRHKMHNPKRSLSTHSWGIAVDIDPTNNLPGTKGKISEELVFVFERHGFSWGGHWETPDPMHFEYYN